MLARLGLGVVLGWILCAACAAGATSVALARWSAPRLLTGCARASSPAPPLVAFPSSQPQVRSGPGALLWTGPGGCDEASAGAGSGGVAAGGGATGGGAAGGAETTRAYAARLGPGALPGAGVALSGGLAEVGAVAGTALGQVLVVGGERVSEMRGETLGGAGNAVSRAAPGATAETGAALTEGRLPSVFAAPLALNGPATPVAVTSGYLGDTAVVSTHRERGARWALAVRVQRHYSATPAAPRLLAAGAVRPSALAAALDYRGDLLVVWAASASIYARELAAGGAVGPIERAGVAAGTGVAELRALISDDGRAIVAWREQASAPARGGPTVTSIEASISGPGMVFAGAATVERFVDLPALEPPPGALRLTRLSSEAVMMAWTGMRSGRYVVRASPVSLRRGVWAPVTISARGRQALLADLVAGPRAEALALWTTAPRLDDGRLDPRRVAIFAAWGHYGGHGEARFASPEAVARAGPNGAPAAAFDPRSDTALAAWALGTQAPRIAYAQRAAGAPVAAAARDERGDGWGVARDVALPPLGLLLVAAAAAWRQMAGHRRAARPTRA